MGSLSPLGNVVAEKMEANTGPKEEVSVRQTEEKEDAASAVWGKDNTCEPQAPGLQFPALQVPSCAALRGSLNPVTCLSSQVLGVPER